MATGILESNPRIEQSRREISELLPELYRRYWEYCDAERVFFIGLRPPEHTTSFDGETFIANQFRLSGGHSLLRTYKHLNHFVWMSCAADDLANSIKHDEALGNTYRFRERNLHASQVVPAFFSFLDHVVYHLHLLSLRTAFTDNDRSIGFKTLRRPKKWKSDMSVISIDDIRAIRRICLQGLNSRSFRLLSLLRNVQVHRFQLGIDEIIQRCMPALEGTHIKIPAPGRIMAIAGFSSVGAPPLRFTELKPLFKQLAMNAKTVMAELADRRLIACDAEDD